MNIQITDVKKYGLPSPAVTDVLAGDVKKYGPPRPVIDVQVGDVKKYGPPNPVISGEYKYGLPMPAVIPGEYKYGLPKPDFPGTSQITTKAVGEEGGSTRPADDGVLMPLYAVARPVDDGVLMPLYAVARPVTTQAVGEEGGVSKPPAPVAPPWAMAKYGIVKPPVAEPIEVVRYGIIRPPVSDPIAVTKYAPVMPPATTAALGEEGNLPRPGNPAVQSVRQRIVDFLQNRIDRLSTMFGAESFMVRRTQQLLDRMQDSLFNSATRQ